MQHNEPSPVLSQPISQREQAYRRIRAMILSGELGPDVLITEKQMAASISMGRTPVREALQDLARDGFVRIIPYRGAIVRSVTLADLLETYEFRLGLECVAASLAAQRATDDEIDAMFDLLNTAEQLRDGRAVVETNQDIHRLIFKAARNQRIAAALEAIQNESERIRRLTIGRDRAFSEHAVEEHWAIVDAIRQRNPKLAEERMREHILEGMRQRMAQLGL